MSRSRRCHAAGRRAARARTRSRRAARGLTSPIPSRGERARAGTGRPPESVRRARRRRRHGYGRALIDPWDAACSSGARGRSPGPAGNGWSHPGGRGATPAGGVASAREKGGPMPRVPFWPRREFLKTGASATAAVTVARALPAVAAEPAPRLRTSLCDLLGIEYPILQSGMGGVAGPALAAAVSGAGGLGILGCAHLPPEEVRTRIRET